MIEQLLDLDRYPLHELGSPEGRVLVERCRRNVADHGMFSLLGLVRPTALAQCIAELTPILRTAAFTHRRSHNIYFDDDIRDLAPNHPALQRFETVHHTICADQIPESLVCRVYEWPPLIEFLALTMGKSRLHLMADPLARANVMAYRDGEALNWHFDRSEFTTTLLLQSPESGGEFQYRRDLRSEDDPNYDRVAHVLTGTDDEVRSLSLDAGTLNVFKGRYTAHRVTPVGGGKERIVAVFSYYEQPDVVFSEEERLGFYGRTSPVS